MEQNLQNLQLPVSIWKIIPTCCHRNKGEVEYIFIYIMKHTNIGAYERYTYRELEFTNIVNNYIEFKLLKAMNVSETT